MLIFSISLNIFEITTGCIDFANEPPEDLYEDPYLPKSKQQHKLSKRFYFFSIVITFFPFF